MLTDLRPSSIPFYIALPQLCRGLHKGSHLVVTAASTVGGPDRHCTFNPWLCLFSVFPQPEDSLLHLVAKRCRTDRWGLVVGAL